MIKGIDKIRLLTTTTEYDRSVYSIVSNNLLGGKPQTVNIHDLETRCLVAKILNKLFVKNKDKSVYDLNIQVVFPISRVNLLMVPDAVIFVNDKPFLLSMTEQLSDKRFYFLRYLVTQKNQHSKILVYFSFSRIVVKIIHKCLNV